MKKQRVDTVAGAVNAMQDALAETIQPPAHVNLRPRDMPFWNSIVSARARSAWDDADLEPAANLARCKSDIEKLQTETDDERDIVPNERGTPIVNPKHNLLETLSRRAVALSRMVHVHAEAKQGESRDQGKRLAAEKAAKQTMDKPSLDAGSLIARPSTH